MPSSSLPVLGLGDANIDTNHVVELTGARIEAMNDPEYFSFEDLDGIPDDEVCTTGTVTILPFINDPSGTR
jgi:hypothetical protein